MSETRRRSNASRDSSDVSSPLTALSSCSNSELPAKPMEESDDTIKLSYWIYFSLALFLTVVSLSFYRNSCFSHSAPKESSPNDFNNKNARLHLQRVTSFGPRTAGSVSNEILAAGYLRLALRDIERQANISGLSASFDEQISGYSSFQSHLHVCSYNNLRNFVLRLRDPRVTSAPSRRAFLVNCHFDSAVGSPGASDAFVSCAVMLELGRVLAKGDIRLLNDIIFLFNGAEESILPASHAFITQHPWADDVFAFLNLEGAGSGGRLLVFQVGPGIASEMLLEAYSTSFQQPFADVIAEEVFRSGLVPSDTDFRIFRDYGFIPGLDMAYISDGYSYHTPFDTECRISSDCLQRTGEDLLKLVSTVVQDKRLASIPKLSPRAYPSVGNNTLPTSFVVPMSMQPTTKVSDTNEKRQVYFDLFGLTLFTFDWTSWKIFNWLLCFCVYCQLFHHRQLYFPKWGALCFSITIQVIGQVFGFLFILSVGYLVHSYGCRMSWYSARYNLFGVYVLPAILWFTWFHTYFLRFVSGFVARCNSVRNLVTVLNWVVDGRPNYFTVERDFFDASVVILSCLITLLTVLNTPAVYVVTLWLFFSSFGRLIHRILFSSADSLCLTRLLLILLPILTCVHSRVCMNLLDFIIPIMGRAGHIIGPDIIVAACVFLIVSPAFLFLAGSLQCTSVRVSRNLRLVLLNACLSYAVLVHASPYGFPYTVSSSNTSDPSISPRFQRVGVFHAVRNFRDKPNDPQITSTDSHVLVLPLDANSIRYLKPNSYPSTVPSSIFTLLHHGDNAYGSALYGGLEELSRITPASCDFSRPYCGIAAIYPSLHYFNNFFFIPTDFHHSKPSTNLHLLSRQVVFLEGLGADRRLWNVTFSVCSGPPHTHITIRTEPPYVLLLRWSFSSEHAIPTPVPLTVDGRINRKQSVGAHYFVYHINAAAVNQTIWQDPLVFWLIFDAISVPGNVASFDISVSGIYMDESLPSSSSPQLRDILSRLPPWTVPMTACTSYDHYRVGLM
ncbi:unnamed protein product [Dicrocoelium dendriticum]|nr:unnamed protein product [Dicrocoelium dendriticum]